MATDKYDYSDPTKYDTHPKPTTYGNGKFLKGTTPVSIEPSKIWNDDNTPEQTADFIEGILKTTGVWYSKTEDRKPGLKTIKFEISIKV